MVEETQVKHQEDKQAQEEPNGNKAAARNCESGETGKEQNNVTKTGIGGWTEKSKELEIKTKLDSLKPTGMHGELRILSKC